MTGADGEYSLYRELASWWPVISPPAEYETDAAAIAAVFESADVPVRTVLDLGSGGGHVAWHLKDGLSLTLVDLSRQMLEVSRKLNPDCAHVQGDMRTVRLRESFDAVLVHDAIDYVTTEHDLRLVIDTAFAHCRPGGVAVFAPDHTAETFRPGAGGGGGNSHAGGRQASFRERTSDPDGGDDWILAEYEFTLSEADGPVRVVREAHRLGCFRRQTWLRLLADAGFTADVSAGAGTGNDVRLPQLLFIGRRPG
ncbi:MAG: class I SAM-dependent methyltransferase [Streptosporangiaceae bacterium]